MAYMCIIASVTRDKVGQIRVPADVAQFASRVACASHFIVPASKELRDALDGGMPLETDVWHPLRGFMFHEPARVQEQAAHLAALAMRMCEPTHPLHSDKWTQDEVAKVIDLFQHASMRGEAVVTHLDLTRTGRGKS